MTAIPFVDLSGQLETARGAFDLVAADGYYVGGARLDAFEREFAAYCGDGAVCVGVGSGTDAIELALRALGVGDGAEVITAANTCVPTVAAIEAAGAKAVLVDALLENATIDPTLLGSAVTPRTKAIVPVHLYGRPADMDAITAFAAERGLLVVEDAAQAHGASVGGRRVGTLGHAAAFSFYPTKNLGALGDGGAVVTGDTEVAERVRLLRSYGEAERYRSVLRGRNSRLDSIQAAVLSARLPLLDERNQRRRELAALYRSELEGAAVELFEEDDGNVYHLFVIRVAARDRLRELLAAEGVETLVHYPRPIHRHPVYRDLAHAGLDRSERLSDEVLSLPLYPELEDRDVGTIAALVRRFTD
ncbi:MAG TPA: DegT/DnrJ/EryC1/StrS family aminotransferase [Gaiellaceae bacterium]|jgi:dTDP-3-amino-3,4,6-trideoxy-alpha-D-glucose transaminase